MLIYDTHMPDKPYLTVTETAQRIDVDTKTIRRWIQIGEFPNAYRLSSVKQSPYRIPLADIEAYEAERGIAPEINK